MIELLATWFRLGKMPWAPGTFGTIGAIPLIIALFYTGPTFYLIGTLVFTVIAVFIAQAHESVLGGHDASEIVIDEVAGFAVTMAWVPLTWQAWLIGFVLFRLLDALKPFPISWVDRKVPGGVGVVADDLLAGVIANIVLQILFVKTAWLGYQLIL